MAPLALASAESGSALELAGTNLTLVVTVAAIAVVALVMGFVFRNQVLSADPGTEKMQEIGAAVEEGAQAFLARQFKTLSSSSSWSSACCSCFRPTRPVCGGGARASSSSARCSPRRSGTSA